MASRPSTHSQHPVILSVIDTVLRVTPSPVDLPPDCSSADLLLPSIPTTVSSTLTPTTPSSHFAVPYLQGLGVLPSRHSDDAPFFDSNHPEDLEDFLLEVDALANTHGVKDEEKVYLAVRYVDSRAKRLWKVADGYEEEVSKCDWSKFKKDLTEVLYNSSVKTRYLEDVVRRWKKRAMSDKECLEVYHREFILLSRKLKKKGFISDMEERRWFWNGIERGTRRRIANRLCLLDKDWDGYSPPPVVDVVKAGRLVLGARLEFFEDDSEEEERPVRRSKRAVAEPSVSSAIHCRPRCCPPEHAVVHLLYCAACSHCCSTHPSGPKSCVP